ncbi:MAG: methylated-DNA--[protein]-cysteine S-methyltransferase [Candidatus Accumulibacter sp.]|nr:methylated-DNA--[protein]-cysteine S-methyltransferase [Accumulibacter sp.]
MTRKTPARTAVNAPFQAITAALGFCVGVRCDDDEIHAIQYLEPRAELLPKNPLAAETLRQVRAYFSDPGFRFALPLRFSGTTFQRRVWEEIAAIPSGHTRSYGEIATSLHNAPRAVGQACGANFFPLIIPCHRVVASGGKLGGFAHQRGGFLLEVKRRLLEHERV